MKSLLEVLNLSAAFLEKKGVLRAKREAEDLLAHILQCDRMRLYLDFERPLSEEELTQYRAAIKMRGDGFPYGYIVKRVPFFGISLNLSTAVIVPRPETELLVEKIAFSLDHEDVSGKNLWDVCTGSGAIGLALKNRFPNLTVTLSDSAMEALEIAKHNAELNQLVVRTLQGDLLTPFKGELVDYLVCNPPYLSEIEYLHVEKEVLKEPKSALVSGATGLEFYIRLSELIGLYLAPKGKAWFEIGKGQGEMVKNLFNKNGYTCRLENDLAGHNRFFFLERDS